MKQRIYGLKERIKANKEREKLALEVSHRMDVTRAAAKLANALQDIYNDVGELPEVKARFESVYSYVSEYSGLENVDG